MIRTPPKHGQLLARGVCRHLLAHDFVALLEFSPQRGMRVDVMALGPKGEIWIVECKSGPADFRADTKWQGYLGWCDAYFWAVDMNFPQDLLPADTGLILADRHDAQILRRTDKPPLAPARRKALTRAFARTAARRLHAVHDPRAAALDDLAIG